MKKILFLLALPLFAMLLSCSDEDDLPQVSISLTYDENATIVGNEVYVVKPNSFVVESLNVEAVRPGHTATNGPVAYWFDGIPLGVNPVEPFGITIPTENLLVGRHRLAMEFRVAEEGCGLATASALVIVHVVKDVTDIPTDDDPTLRMNLEYTLK